MKYFKDKNDTVFAYDDKQIKDGCSKGLIEIDEVEKDNIIKSNIPTLSTQDKINKEKSYLASTDWVVTKITEEQIKGNDIAPLLTKYAIELSKRDAARISINDLESQL